MKDINAEGFEDRLYMIQVEDLQETFMTIDNIRKPEISGTPAYVIRMHIAKLGPSGEVSMYYLAQLFLPSLKKGGVIAADQDDDKEPSNDELIIIKESKDLDNLENRKSNPSLGSLRINKPSLKFKANYVDDPSGDDHNKPKEEKALDKSDIYLSK